MTLRLTIASERDQRVVLVEPSGFAWLATFEGWPVIWHDRAIYYGRGWFDPLYEGQFATFDTDRGAMLIACQKADQGVLYGTTWETDEP